MNPWFIMVLSVIISGVVSAIVNWLFYHKQCKEQRNYLKKKIAEIERENMKCEDVN